MIVEASEIEALAREAGINVSCFNGAGASCVFTDGCHGVARTEFERFASLVEAAAMERAAKIAEAKIDTKEATRASAAVDAAKGDDDTLQRLRHASSVRLWNCALEQTAAAIRAAAKKEA